jgi:glutaredoxin 3
MKCPVHHLAMGPDGRCVLCRRDHTAPRTTVAPPRDRRRLVQAGAAIGVVLCGIGAATLWPRRSNEAALGGGPAVRSQAPDASGAAPTAARQPWTEPRREPRVLPPDLPLAPDAEQPADPLRAALDGSVPDAAAPAEAGAPPKGPTEQQIRAAIQRIPVTVYTTRTCPICTAARAFLTANQIPYTDKDVESSPALLGELASLNPNRTVPTFLIDGQIIVGFDPTALAQFIKSRVEKQLGAKLDIRVPKTAR